MADIRHTPKHETLRELIHLADGGGPWGGFIPGAFREKLPLGSFFPMSCTWWESSAKLKKILELTVTRNPNKTLATKTWIAYNTDGVTPVETITETIARSGIIETSRTRS